MYASALELSGLAGSTIGIGQMRMGLANRLTCDYFGIDESMATTTRRLALNNTDGIALAGDT